MLSAITAWQDWLRHERRAAENTVVSYEHDLRGFLGFLTDHLGYPAGLADLAGLTKISQLKKRARAAGEHATHTRTQRGMLLPSHTIMPCHEMSFYDRLVKA